MAIPLIERGHSVSLIAKKVPSFVKRYAHFNLVSGTKQYLEAIDLHKDRADVFHCHNEPSWYVTAIKERCNKPVVLDVHDSYLTRLTPEEEDEMKAKGESPVRIVSDERNNFQLADALVFPGKVFASEVIDEFTLGQPHIILPSYLPREFYQYKGWEYLGGLVYEGMIQHKSALEQAASANAGFKYADYLELAQKCKDIGIDFHLYTGIEKKEIYESYKDIAFLHGGRSYEDLLPCLTRHDWGLVGNIHPTKEWDVAFPNKMFEYISASVPVVAINARAASEFIEEWGVGITVNSMEELASRWSEHRKIRERLIKVRQNFIMENHIGELENLYGSF